MKSSSTFSKMVLASLPATLALLFGAVMLLMAGVILFRSPSSHADQRLRRLSPECLQYSEPGSGVPQVIKMTLRNATNFDISNIQVIPSCGCVVDDFDVIDLKPNESEVGTLTLRNDEGDIRTIIILVQYSILGTQVDELVELGPKH